MKHRTPISCRLGFHRTREIQRTGTIQYLSTFGGELRVRIEIIVDGCRDCTMTKTRFKTSGKLTPQDGRVHPPPAPQLPVRHPYHGSRQIPRPPAPPAWRQRKIG